MGDYDYGPHLGFKIFKVEPGEPDVLLSLYARRFHAVGAPYPPIKFPVKPGCWAPKRGGADGPKICIRGWHIYNTQGAASEVYGLYKTPNYRIFITEARGEWMQWGNKSVHQQIRLVREISPSWGDFGTSWGDFDTSWEIKAVLRREMDAYFKEHGGKELY